MSEIENGAPLVHGRDFTVGDRYPRRFDRPVVVVDVEATGLDPARDQVWELAAILLDGAGGEWLFTAYVEHDTTLAEALPETFRADHDVRYGAATRLGLVWTVDRLRDRGETPSDRPTTPITDTPEDFARALGITPEETP